MIYFQIKTISHTVYREDLFHIAHSYVASHTPDSNIIKYFCLIMWAFDWTKLSLWPMLWGELQPTNVTKQNKVYRVRKVEWTQLKIYSMILGWSEGHPVVIFSHLHISVLELDQNSFTPQRPWNAGTKSIHVMLITPMDIRSHSCRLISSHPLLISGDWGEAVIIKWA